MRHEAKFRSWAKEAQVPHAIIETIIRHAPTPEDFKSPGEEMVPQVYPLEGILAVQSRDEIDIDALAEGFLVIGSCPNGDPIVIDVGEQLGSIWYLSHEDMFRRMPLRSIAAKVADDIGEFVSKCEDETFPIDYYDVKRGGAAESQ